MNTPTAYFPEFGGRGDTLGARRTRRAFQLCVASCVIFTGLLWFSENYLRHDRAEVLYQRAVTLDAPSARVLLRQAVELDQAQSAYPDARYLEALAERVEHDEVLTYLEEAYSHDSRNPTLAIRYGCALLRRAQASEARDRFREAAQHAPQNALPLYLEAAATPWLENGGEDRLTESLALVAKANGGGHPVVFPQPSWPEDLPRTGWWYAELRKQAIRESCELLIQYTMRVTADARRALESGQVHNWDTWLKTLETKGMRIASAPQGGVAAARCGLLIQESAIHHRRRIAEADERDVEALNQKLANIEEARAELAAFEAELEPRVASMLANRQLPMRVAGYSLAALFVVFVGAATAGRAVRVTRNQWTITHSLPGIAIPLATGVALFATLMAMSVLTRWPQGGGEAAVFTQYVWALILIAASVFGVVYPGLLLPSAQEAASRRMNDIPLSADETLAAARTCRRQACVGLARRYYGLLLGATLCGVCMWIVGHRILTQLYPWDLRLMRTGLSMEEFALVEQMLSRLL